MTKKYLLESINIIVLIINIILYTIALTTLNIYSSNKTITHITSLILLIIILYKLYFAKRVSLYNIGVFLCFITNTILIINIINLNNDYQYLNNIINKQYTYEKYNIYVSKKNPYYSDITKLSNKNIGILNENYTNTIEYLNKKVTINYKEYKNINELEQAFISNEIQSFILSENKFQEIPNTNLKSETRIISSHTIKNTID